MKNKAGTITGFVLGAVLSFLGIAVLSYLHPEEDLAGITIGTVLIAGVFSAILGSKIQNTFLKNKY
ncbi:hypothetical protein [Pedobacter sp. MW01-1-1]|uniref:hypothetical protein n=1 Tax=Pedobacter sp. MW01-1-1 TaxID=3383027 RepID=UPI003FEF81DA